MNQREQLIEDAREFANGSHLGKPTARELDRAIILMRDLLAALDEPRPVSDLAGYAEIMLPTDDEREALARHCWYTVRWGDGAGGYSWKCSCGVNSWGTFAENPERYKRHETEREAALGAVEHTALGFHRTVQGEPSDAQVLAALNAREKSIHDRNGGRMNGYIPAPNLDYWDSQSVEHMRAALRDAAEAGGER